MDFEFRKDTLTDSYKVLISMEQAALGTWVQESLGSDNVAIKQIMDEIAQLKQHQKEEYRLTGEEMTLTLTREDACVCANSAMMDYNDELQDDMNYYDAESVAVCGLEDFEGLLQAWQQFINGR